MTWKLFGLGSLAVLAAASVYPGIPFGGPMTSRGSAAGSQTEMTCYSLHWDGVHRKIVTIRDDASSSYKVTNAPCWHPPS